MELETVNTAASMIDRILADREAKRASLEEKQEKEYDALSAAEEAMQAAADAGDIKAYRKGKAARQAAADAIEMYERHLFKVTGKDLITTADYEKTIADIHAEIKQTEEKTKEKLFLLSSKMKAAADELETAVRNANKVISRLQHDLYRDADRMITVNGDTMYILDENRAVNATATINWGKVAADQYQYKLYKFKMEGKK